MGRPWLLEYRCERCGEIFNKSSTANTRATSFLAASKAILHLDGCISKGAGVANLIGVLDGSFYEKELDEREIK